MKRFRKIFKAEILKLKGSNIVWISFLAFAIAPLMGGLFFFILEDPQAMEKAEVLAAKAELMGFRTNWRSYLILLTQAMGVGGVLLFGFIVSWIFGREYSDGTVTDLLALPTSRTSIINAKYLVYIVWGITLAFSNLLIGAIIGILMGLSSSPMEDINSVLIDYSVTTILTLVSGTPIALLALYGKGFLAPLGFVVITLVLSQIIAASGYGDYFPWSIPALHSGLGEEVKNSGYFVLFLTGIVGYILTMMYWRKADQHS